SPYSWRGNRLVANTCGTHGFSIGMSDSTWYDLEAIGCGQNGFNLAGAAPNSHFDSCRAEFCNNGLSLNSAWAQGTGTGGCFFTAFSTDRNTQNGIQITATGTVPVTFANLMLRRDGRNGNSGGGGFAGFNCNGSTIPVIVDGCCFPGVDDDGTGTNSPQYGFSITGSSANVVLKGGFWQGNTAGVNDDGTSSNWFRGPNVLEATGATNAQTYASSYPASVVDGVRALGEWTPRNHSVIAWAENPNLINSGTSVTNGTVYLIGLQVNRAATATKLYWGINTPGVSATASQNFVGLYNSSGTLLQSVGVDARVTTAGSNMFTETISVAVKPGLYWVGMVFNAGTPPQVYKITGNNLSASLSNVGLSVSTARHATAGTTQTSLPSPITPSSNVLSQLAFWAAIG
ncbi:MAG TPA: hypothetical protein VNH17_13250, partial [Streptosporangiaceae bacterium]|nr:hypothetical protein [Streptosporangiaceae bacterium]